MVFVGKTKNPIPFLIPAALANFTFTKIEMPSVAKGLNPSLLKY